MDPLGEFGEYLADRRADLLASPRSGSRDAAVHASESPVEHGLGMLLAATGATGGSVRQSIGFTQPSSTPGAASAAEKPGLEWRGRVREGAEKLQRAYGFKSGGMAYYQIRLMRWTRRLSSIAQGPASGVAANAHRLIKFCHHSCQLQPSQSSKQRLYSCSHFQSSLV